MNPKFLKPLVYIVALCGIALLAQSRPAGTKIVQTSEKSAVHTPAVLTPGLARIYSNLGPSTDAYNDESAEVISGPTSILNFSLAYALPFTPKTDATVHEVMASLVYNGSGANQINLSLYSDANGVPGTILAGPETVKNLPSFGTCCKMASWSLSTPLAVSAETQYWIVADTPASGPGSDFYGAWNFVFPTPFVQASNEGGMVWAAQKTGYFQTAAGVFGTTP
ncbi:MAG TPA: choice-of-anchor R domain-containing protein [Candidatus Sulfotelmatobacter sp.]